MASAPVHRDAQKWFIDQGAHPRSAADVVRHRACLDLFLHYLAVLALVLLVLVSFGAMVLSSVGLSAVSAAVFSAPLASPFQPALLLTALVLLFGMLGPGEWSLFHNHPHTAYVYYVTLSVGCPLLAWLGVMCAVDVLRGTEWIEENWFILSTTAIPFTTRLDTKLAFESIQLVLMLLALITAGLLLHPVTEALKCLGGPVRLLQTRLGALMPGYLVLLTLAGLTGAYGSEAAYVSPWASAGRATAAVLWQGSVAYLVLALLLGALVCASHWGASFLLHAVLGLTLIPAAFVLLVTSSVTVARAREMPEYVRSNWDALLIDVVPEEYSYQPWDKYGSAAFTPMAAAGATGLFLSFGLALMIAHHLQSANLLLAFGAELARIQDERIEAEKQRAAHGLPSAPPPPMTPSAREHAELLERRVADAARGGGKGGAVAVYYGSAAAAPIYAPPAELDLALVKDAPASSYSTSAMASPLSLRPNGGSSGSSLTPTRAAPRSEAREPLLGACPGGGYGSVEASSSSSVSGGGGVAMWGAGNGSSKAGGAGDGGATAPRPAARGPLLRIGRDARLHEHDPISALNDREEALGSKLRWASPLHFGRALLHEGRVEFSHSRTCLAAGLIVALMTVIAVSVGMATLATAGVCGVLGGPQRVSATWTGSYVFASFETPADGLRNNLVISHTWPYGSVRINALYFNTTAAELDPRVNVTATFFGPPGASLPSSADFKAGVNYTRVLTPELETVTLVVSLPPPLGARDGCLGVTLDLFVSAPWVHLTLDATEVLINVTGSLAYIAPPTVSPPTLTTAEVYTDTGPVVLTNVFLDDQLPGDVNNITTHLTVASGTGDVSVKSSFAPGIDISTGGTVRVSLAASASPFATCKAQGVAGDDAPAGVWVGPPGAEVRRAWPPAWLAASFAGAVRENASAAGVGVDGSSSSGGGSGGGGGACRGGGALTAVIAALGGRGGAAARSLSGLGAILPGDAGVCGNVRLAARGSGRLSVSQAFGANTASLSTESGTLVASNTGMIMGRVLNISTTTGSIYTNSLLQLFGNETFIRSSAGDISGTVVYANRLTATTSGPGAISLLELFLGVADPGSLVYPPINPKVANISDPMVVATTDRGSLTLVGVGGSPSLDLSSPNTRFANYLDITATSRLGSVKGQLSGGSYNGDFSISSSKSTTTLDIDGLDTWVTSGYIGDPATGRGHAVLSSYGGSVQMAVLPSAI